MSETDAKGGQNPGGTDPTKNGSGSGQPVFDPSKLSDDDFAKLFDDSRLYNHARFKKLNEQASKAKEYEAEKKKFEEAELVKRGEFEKLAKSKEEEAASWKKRYDDSTMQNAVILEATKKGIKYPDAALKLIDRTNLKIGEDGTVTGVAEALDVTIKAYPTLLTVTGSSVGSPTNPGGQQTPNVFKMSQLADPKFYEKNREAIAQALQTGKIIEDRF